MRLIAAKIDVTKIDKNRLFQGKNGAKYLDVLLQEVTDDRFGNDFRVVQQVSKEEREKGVRGEILGNAKYLGRKPEEPKPRAASAPATASQDSPGQDNSDLPF